MIFRIYAKELAFGQVKERPFSRDAEASRCDKQIQAKTVLFDSWYGSWQNLKLVHRLGLTFYTTLKANRLVSLSAEDLATVHLDVDPLNYERLAHGIIVKLMKVPFKVRVVQMLVANRRH